MDNGIPGSKQDNFTDAPRNINFVYNQLEHELDQKLPPEPIRSGKYVLVGVFFFFAIGIIFSLLILVNNIAREQKADSVSANENLTPMPVDH